MTHAVATRAMIPDARGGKIVNVTLSPHHGLPGMAHSSAARAAVENLTRVLSIEWARFGIRLTAMAPGPMATETMQDQVPAGGGRGRGGHGAAPAARHRGGVRLARGLPRLAWRATTSPARSSPSTARATTGSAPGRRAVSSASRASRWPRSGGRSSEGGPGAPDRAAADARLARRGLRAATPRSSPTRPSREALGKPAARPRGGVARHGVPRRRTGSSSGFGHWVLEERDSGEFVGRAGLLRPAGLARPRGRLDRGAASTGARATRPRPLAPRARGRTTSSARATSSASSTPRTPTRSASPRSSARSSRAAPARATSTCSCTGPTCR